MRRAGYESGWHLTKDGDVLGFSLLGDFCTEHEIGVRPLKEALGVPRHFERGIADRVNTKQPPAFRLETYTDTDGRPAALMLIGSADYARLVEPNAELVGWVARETEFRAPFDSAMRTNPKEARARADFAAAWDENGCLVRVRGLGNVHRLQKMAQALETNDLAFGGALVGKDTVQRVGGLTFVRASKVDPEIQEEVLQQDQKEGRLQAAADEILPNLKADLKAQGKNWFALSPAWVNKDDESEGLKFWLNPYEQQDYHSGWFREEALRAWGRNEGPVLRDKELERVARANQNVLGKIGKAMHRAKILTPWFSTVRSDGDDGKFVIQAHYNSSQKVRAGWRKIEEGTYTLPQLWAKVPSRGTEDKVQTDRAQPTRKRGR
jgi:hypothetical protein